MADTGIRSLVAKVVIHLDTRTKRAILFWGVSLTAVVPALGWMLIGSRAWRQGSWAPLLLDLLLLGIVVGAWVLLRLLRRHWMTERRVASTLEATAGLRPGSVVGALELSHSVPVGSSVSLAVRAEERLVSRLSGSAPQLSGVMDREVRSWTRRGLGTLAVSVPLLLLLAFAAPERMAGTLRGLAAPFSTLAQPTFAPLEVSPGNAEVLRGSPAQILVKAPGRIEVALRWQADGDVAKVESKSVEAGGIVRFSFPSITAVTRYWAEAPDGARSQEYVLQPIDPLFVTELGIEVTFPSYTGRSPEEYNGEVPPLTVPLGARFSVRGLGTRPLSEASIRLGGESVGEFDVVGRRFSGSWSPRRSGTYDWVFSDQEGQPAELAPPPLELTVVPDSAPIVRFLFPAVDTVLPATLRQPLVIEAGDDYGLDALELEAYRVTAFGEEKEPVVQRLDLAGTRSALARPLLDVSGWGLLPGESVRYRARVVDNAPSAHVVETREFVLRMPLPAELRQNAQERLEDAAARMEELAEAATGAQEEARKMERQQAAKDRQEDDPRLARENETLDFQEQQDVQQTLDHQETLVDQVDSLSAELRALSESLREAGLADADVRRDLNELQQLLSEISSPEIRARLDELREGLESMDSRAVNEALRDLAEEQENFRRRLEESLERFRRAAVEQDFRATTAEAEELARQEDALSDALREEGESELRVQQQEGLEQRAQDLSQRLERLEQRLTDLGEEEVREGVESAQERAQTSEQMMRQAGEMAQKSQPQEASQEAQRASEVMQEAADELRKAQQEMAEQMQELMEGALRQTAADALALAREQSELREEMRSGEARAMSELRADESALVQGARNMAENLSQAAQASGMGNKEVVVELGKAMSAMGRTVESLDAQRGNVASPYSTSEAAIQALNQVAMLSVKGADQVGEGGGESVQEQLEQLAQDQGQVMNEAGSLMPLQLGEEAMAQQAQQLSQEQATIADELGDMADDPNSERETLGDLEALAEEARLLAERLAAGRLDAETVERQERLFHRLLDAGRSLEQEEISEERESTAPGGFERIDVAPLPEGTLGALRYPLPQGIVLQQLSPAHRQLVLEYFERLNRGNEALGGGMR